MSLPVGIKPIQPPEAKVIELPRPLLENNEVCEALANAAILDFNAARKRMLEGAKDATVQTSGPREYFLRVDGELFNMDYLGVPLETVKVAYIVATVRHSKGHLTEAARKLGITIKSLYNVLHANNMFERKPKRMKALNNGN